MPCNHIETCNVQRLSSQDHVESEVDLAWPVTGEARLRAAGDGKKRDQTRPTNGVPGGKNEDPERCNVGFTFLRSVCLNTSLLKSLFCTSKERQRFLCLKLYQFASAVCSALFCYGMDRYAVLCNDV